MRKIKDFFLNTGSVLLGLAIVFSLYNLALLLISFFISIPLVLFLGIAYPILYTLFCGFLVEHWIIALIAYLMGFFTFIWHLAR